MTVTGTLDMMKDAWRNRVNPLAPILYVLDNQDNVVSAFPIAGDGYQWLFEPQPKEVEFIAQYPFAVRVLGVAP